MTTSAANSTWIACRRRARRTWDIAARRLQRSMRRRHFAGEKPFVDYAAAPNPSTSSLEYVTDTIVYT